jgi:hypothetical protein
MRKAPGADVGIARGIWVGGSAVRQVCVMPQKATG